MHGDHSVDFLATGKIAQQGGLNIVGEASVLGVRDGLQPAHAFGIEADRVGDLAAALGGSRSAARGQSTTWSGRFPTSVPCAYSEADCKQMQVTIDASAQLRR